LIAAGPARRFRLDARGRLAVGCNADLTFVDLAASFTLKPAALLQRHPTSPYLGSSFQGIVRRTIRRGETIFADGAVTAETRGTLVQPRRP
jgi:allantoinase